VLPSKPGYTEGSEAVEVSVPQAPTCQPPSRTARQFQPRPGTDTNPCTGSRRRSVPPSGPRPTLCPQHRPPFRQRHPCNGQAITQSRLSAPPTTHGWPTSTSCAKHRDSAAKRSSATRNLVKPWSSLRAGATQQEHPQRGPCAFRRL
jgi:hypothetical protein